MTQVVALVLQIKKLIGRGGYFDSCFVTLRPYWPHLYKILYSKIKDSHDVQSIFHLIKDPMPLGVDPDSKRWVEDVEGRGEANW